MAVAPHSTIADLSSKKSTLFRLGQNGLANSLRWRETFLTKVVLHEQRWWNYGAEILLNVFKN
jgi:hypothetical protein